MSLCTVKVINTAPGCNNELSQQFTGNCDSFIVRLSSNSNALGPFDIYLDNVIFQSGITRTEMFDGVVITCGCPTPTPTPTVTSTPNSTPTPTATTTPGVTPTATETSTPTPSTTPSLTPSFTPSPTQTTTPGITPTATETLTSTPSLTPSFTPSLTPTSTPIIFEIYLITQDGINIMTQNNEFLIPQEII
jgi:hypothetical protein